MSYPEQGKLGVFERPPGDGKLREFFRVETAVDYTDRLEPPVPPVAP